MSDYDTFHTQLKAAKDSGDPKALKSAYRKLSKQWHPDVNKSEGATEVFKALGNAYDDVKAGKYTARATGQGAWRSSQQRSGSGAHGAGSTRGNTGNNHSGARSNSGGAGGKQQSGDAGARARAEAQAKARAEQAKARAEAQAKARAEQAKARAEEQAKARSEAAKRARSQAKAQAKAQAESLERAAKVRAEKMQARTDQWAKVKATFGDAFKDPLGAMRGDKAPPKATNLGKASGAAKSPAGMATAAGIGAVVAGAVYVQSMAPKNVAASENPWLKNSVAQNQRGNPFLKNTRWQDRMQRATQDNSASIGR